MKLKIVILVILAASLHACKKCINYEAPVISFANEEIIQNDVSVIYLDSAKTDTNLTISIKIATWSFAVNKIHVDYVDSLLRWKTNKDSLLYAKKELVFEPVNIQPLDEYFIEKITFKLQRNHKYYWKICVSDEKNDKISNTINKQLIVK